MEIAALEIARLSDELSSLQASLTASEQARLELEAHLLSAQERTQEIEAEVRDECWREMEERMRGQMARYMASWEAERERSGEHLDRKLEVLTRVVDVEVYDEEGEDKENVDYGRLQGQRKERETEIENLEEENERLRREVAQLRREVGGGKSPSKSKSKRSVLGEAKGFVLEEGMGRLRLDGSIAGSYNDESLTGLGRGSSASLDNERLSASSSASQSKSPTKKVRKFTARKWDLMTEEEMDRL